MPPFDSSDAPAAPDDGLQRNRRMGLRRKVSLKFKEFQGFVNEYSENVSTGGMFIRTPSPQPPGSMFDFEFTLGDDYTLIHGIGEVVWVREEDESFDRPAGMGVRFLSLDPDSRKLIDRMVKERIARQQGAPPPPPPDRPWDEPAWDEDPPEPEPVLAWEEPEPEPPLTAPPPPGPAATEEPPPPAHPGSPTVGASPYAYARSYRGSGVARRDRRRRPLLVVLLAIAFLVALLAAFFLFFPETAVRLLVGGEGGGRERLAEVGRPDAESGPPAGGPVEPVPRGDAGDVLEAPPPDAAPPEAGDEAADEERELGFFAPSPERDPEEPEETAPAPANEAPAAVPDAPAEAPAQAEAPSAFTRVLNIVWEDQGGEVLITVHLDGAVEEWDYSTARIGAPPPRELVRIEGVVRPFPRSEIPVGTELLERIRVGFHPEARGSQLHLVLDLATADVELARTEAEGSELRLYLARRDG